MQRLPAVNPDGLRDIQVTALTGNEQSLAADRPRSLITITMGGGKTICAVAESYRLLTYAKANRVLFLVTASHRTLTKRGRRSAFRLGVDFCLARSTQR